MRRVWPPALNRVGHLHDALKRLGIAQPDQLNSTQVVEAAEQLQDEARRHDEAYDLLFEAVRLTAEERATWPQGFEQRVRRFLGLPDWQPVIDGNGRSIFPKPLTPQVFRAMSEGPPDNTEARWSRCLRRWAGKHKRAGYIRVTRARDGRPQWAVHQDEEVESLLNYLATGRYEPNKRQP